VADPRLKEPAVNGTEASGKKSGEGPLAALTALAPEAGPLDLDPALFGRALGAAAVSVARHPAPAARAGLRCALDLTRTSLAAAARAAGVSAAGPVPSDAGDRRFSDPAWEDNAGFFALRQSYLVLRRLAEDLVAVAELDEATRAKAHSS
jgi:polyhydroxyalkanoate synthase subunit PhaC